MNANIARFQSRGADARRRMKNHRTQAELLDAIDRGETPAEMLPGVPMTEAWMETFRKQIEERKRIRAASLVVAIVDDKGGQA